MLKILTKPCAQTSASKWSNLHQTVVNTQRVEIWWSHFVRSAYLPAAHFFKVLSFKSETFSRKKKISEVNYRTFGLHHSHAWGKLPLAGCEIASCGYIANIFTNPFMKIHSSGYICKYSPANIFIRHIALQICPLDIMPCKYFHKLFKKIRSSGYICKYPC